MILQDRRTFPHAKMQEQDRIRGRRNGTDVFIACMPGDGHGPVYMEIAGENADSHGLRAFPPHLMPLVVGDLRHGKTDVFLRIFRKDLDHHVSCRHASAIQIIVHSQRLRHRLVGTLPSGQHKGRPGIVLIVFYGR